MAVSTSRVCASLPCASRQSWRRRAPRPAPRACAAACLLRRRRARPRRAAPPRPRLRAPAGCARPARGGAAWRLRRRRRSRPSATGRRLWKRAAGRASGDAAAQARSSGATTPIWRGGASAQAGPRRRRQRLDVVRQGAVGSGDFDHRQCTGASARRAHRDRRRGPRRAPSRSRALPSGCRRWAADSLIAGVGRAVSPACRPRSRAPGGKASLRGGFARSAGFGGVLACTASSASSASASISVNSRASCWPVSVVDLSLTASGARALISRRLGFEGGQLTLDLGDSVAALAEASL